MAATTTSVTATIIKEAEHVVIDEATAVAKQLTTKNAADIKGIVNGVAKETVAASDDSYSTIFQNVEDGAKAIGGEILKGTEAAVEAVEKHPELIAEGAFALGVGVVSIVQPELIPGSVALIGKMASDATKDTIHGIVVDSSTGVVKGVSKEVTDETAKLAAQDAADKAKNAALETAKDGAKPGIQTTVDVKAEGNVKTEIVPTGLKKGETPGAKVQTTVSGDATAVVREVTPGDAPGPVISSKTVQTSATAEGEVKGDSISDSKAGPSIVAATNNLTGDKTAMVQQGSTIVALEQPHILGKVPEEPKTVAVTKSDVEPSAKEVAQEKTELEAEKSTQTGGKIIESTVSEESSSNESLKTAAAKLEADLKESAAKANLEQPSTSQGAELSDVAPVEKESSQDVQDEREESIQPSLDHETESKAPATEKPPNLTQPGLVHSDSLGTPDIKEETKPEKSEDQKPTKGLETDGSREVAENKSEADPVSEIAASTQQTTHSDQVHEPPKTTQTASNGDATAHATTHAAVLEAHKKIAKLHESNDLLHQKLDTMQEALLAITKALAERPSPSPPASKSAAESEPVATEHNQIVLASASAPSMAAINKRMSVFGSIGWLFGAGSGSKTPKQHKRGKSVATSTPATVPAGGM